MCTTSLWKPLTDHNHETSTFQKNYSTFFCPLLNCPSKTMKYFQCFHIIIFISSISCMYANHGTINDKIRTKLAAYVVNEAPMSNEGARIARGNVPWCVQDDTVRDQDQMHPRWLPRTSSDRLPLYRPPLAPRSCIYGAGDHGAKTGDGTALVYRANTMFYDERICASPRIRNDNETVVSFLHRYPLPSTRTSNLFSWTFKGHTRGNRAVLYLSSTYGFLSMGANSGGIYSLMLFEISDAGANDI